MMSCNFKNDIFEIHNKIKDYDDSKYIEMLFERLFNQFQLDYSYLEDVDFLFLYHMKIPPSELNDLEFYRIEGLIDKYNKEIEKENKAKEEQHAREERESKRQQSASKLPNYKLPKH